MGMNLVYNSLDDVDGVGEEVKNLALEVKSRGYDVNNLVRMYFNQVIYHTDRAVGEYDGLRNVPPEELAENLLRSIIVLDEEAGKRAKNQFDKLNRIRERQLLNQEKDDEMGE